MSLEVNVNILRGWPNPSIVEKSLPAASGVTLSQGDIAVLNASGQWSKPATTAITALPFIIMVDSTDPSTNRGAHKSDYRQVAYGAIHGIAFNNALEIETANYKTTDTYVIGSELTAKNGQLCLAASTETVIGTVTRAPYSMGNKTYLTFVPRDNRAKA